MQKGTKIIEQVDLTQRGISEDSETVRESRYRSLRFHVVPLGYKGMYGLCISVELEESASLRLPSLYLNRPRD